MNNDKMKKVTNAISSIPITPLLLGSAAAYFAATGKQTRSPEQQEQFDEMVSDLARQAVGAVITNEMERKRVKSSPRKSQIAPKKKKKSRPSRPMLKKDAQLELPLPRSGGSV